MGKKLVVLLLLAGLLLLSCNRENLKTRHVRQLIDTVGFTQYNWQFDSILSRIAPADKIPAVESYKAVICPHDDYAYAAGLYAKTLSGIKAKTVFLIGVAHKAKKFGLQDKLIFGDYDAWKCNDDEIPVSDLRDSILKRLPSSTYVVHDSMMQLEHSLEAINPFLKHQVKDVKIIPVLVPYMRFEDMEKFADQLAGEVYAIMKNKRLSFGKDVAIVISNDAIHYGNTDWGGSDLAPFGVDSAGNAKARAKDKFIIENYLKGELNTKKIKEFNETTVKKDDYKAYQWTWCGRYSVPFGLLFANKLNERIYNFPLKGYPVDYRFSYPAKHIKVNDLNMGTTAPAKPSHWVAYVGMWYR